MMPEKKPELTPAEWDIMRVVWDRKEVIVHDVFEALRERRGWAQTSVRTMMERLTKKGYLKQKKIGPVCVYQSAVARKHVVRRTLGDVVNRLANGSVADLVAYAVEDGNLSTQELSELENLIRLHKEKKEKDNG